MDGSAFWDCRIHAKKSVPEASVMGADVTHPHVGLEPGLQHLVREVEFSRNFLAIPEGQVSLKMMKLAGGEELDDQPGWRCCRGCVGVEVVGERIRIVKGAVCSRRVEGAHCRPSSVRCSMCSTVAEWSLRLW